MVGSSSVSAADQTAGVTATAPTQNGQEVRATFKASANRDIAWSVVFK